MRISAALFILCFALIFQSVQAQAPDKRVGFYASCWDGSSASINEEYGELTGEVGEYLKAEIRAGYFFSQSGECARRNMRFESPYDIEIGFERSSTGRNILYYPNQDISLAQKFIELTGMELEMVPVVCPPPPGRTSTALHADAFICDNKGPRVYLQIDFSWEEVADVSENILEFLYDYGVPAGESQEEDCTCHEVGPITTFNDGFGEMKIEFSQAGEESINLAIPLNYEVMDVKVSVEGLPVSTQRGVPVDVVLVTDLSTMTHEELSKLKEAALRFADEILSEEGIEEGNMLGLVSYANGVRTYVGLTNVKDRIQEDIEGYIVGGESCIACGMRKALELINEGTNYRKAILFMSTGPPYVSRWADSVVYQPVEKTLRYAQEALEEGVNVYTVSYGEDGDVYTMELIARRGGGRHYPASTEDIVEVYDRIAYIILTGAVEGEGCPKNPSIALGRDTLWHHSGPFYDIETINLDLDGAFPGCDCPSCNIQGDLCNIGLKISSESEGILRLSDLHINACEYRVPDPSRCREERPGEPTGPTESRPTGNSKDVSKFIGKTAFLISDKNWQDVLSLVPVTIWTDDSGIVHKYPTLIYASNHFNSVISFLSQYEPDYAILVGQYPSTLPRTLSAYGQYYPGLKPEQIVRINPSDYFSYWSKIQNVVVVDAESYENALMASVYASYINAPLLLVDSSNLNTYENVIENRDIIIIGEVDSSVLDYITAKSKSMKSYSLEELEEVYTSLTGTDKLILVNPSDLEYDKTSLAAPILAAAKQELILSKEVPRSSENRGCHDEPTVTENYETVRDFMRHKLEGIVNCQCQENDEPTGLRTVDCALTLTDHVEYDFDMSAVLEEIRNSGSDVKSRHFRLSLQAMPYSREISRIYLFINGNLIKDKKVSPSSLISSRSFNPDTGECEPIRSINFEISGEDIPGDGVFKATFKTDKGLIFVKNCMMVYYVPGYDIPDTLISPPIFPEGYKTETAYFTGAYGGDDIIFNIPNPSRVRYHYLFLDYERIGINEQRLYVNGQYIDNPISSYHQEFETSDENVEVKIIPISREGRKGWAWNFRLESCSCERHSFKYLTIVASPRFIPDSLYHMCMRGAQYRYTVDYDYFHRVHSISAKRSVGRIYGLETSDVSAYVARSIFYEELFDNVYDQNEFTGISLGCDFPYAEEDAALIKEKTSASEYDTKCFGCAPVEGCNLISNFHYSDLTGKQFITYAGHGWVGDWAGVMSASNLPLLDLAYGYAYACSTCNYWQGGRETFCLQFLRKGGIGYIGSVGLEPKITTNLPLLPSSSIKFFTGETRKPLGDYLGPFSMYPILIGDPTLIPVFKEVDWSQ